MSDESLHFKRHEFEMMMESTKNAIGIILAIDELDARHVKDGQAIEGHYCNQRCADLMVEIAERRQQFDADTSDLGPQRWW